MKKNITLLGTLVSLLFIFPDGARSQSASVTGTVKDMNGTLPGVTVRVQGTPRGATADLSGHFQITALPSGDHTLVFTYIGFAPTEKTISLSDNQRLDLGRITLQESVEDLDEVVVSGTYLPSQMRALTLQREAANIQNVIAADGIGKLPDRNAAEAVQRVPGVTIERDQGEGRFALVRGTPIEWSSNLINGDRLPSTDGFSGSRQVALDVVPSELIEYVIISKALTPDTEGDAIGGSINFITRKAPAQRTLNVSAAGGYNAQVEDASYNGSLIYGERFGKFGFLASAAVWNRPWASDNYELEYNFEQPGAAGFSVNNLQLRDYEGRRNTVGLNLAAQYDLTVNHSLFVRGIYDVFRDYEFARQHNFYFPEGPDEEDPNEGAAEITLRNAGFNTQLYGGELGGDHRFSPRWSLDWKASTYATEVTFGDDNNDLAEENSGIQIVQFQQGGTFSNASSDNYTYWNFDAPNGGGGSGEAFRPGFDQALDPNQMILTLAGVFIGDSKEEDRVGQFNVKYEPGPGVTYKLGGKYRNKRREATNRQDFYVPLGLFGAPVPLSFYSDYEQEPYDTKGGFLEELGTPYQNVLLDEMMTEGALNGLLVDVFDNLDNYFPATATPNELAGFEGTENVAAAYAMGDWSLTDKLSLTGGARFEHTRVKLQGYELDTAGSLTQLSASASYGSLLPMVHFKYTLNDNTNLRLAYTRSLARPNFADLNPNRTVSDLGSGIILVSGGNPELKPTYSNNFDLLGEHFFQDVGVVSGGVFYKDLSNVIFSNVNQVASGGSTIRTSAPENVESAWLFGVELAFSKRFTFLPGFLEGFGVNANYTYTQSEVEVPRFDAETGAESIDVQTLINQPEHIYNLSLFYEKYGLTARLAANFKGAYVDEYRVEAGPSHYRYYDKNLTLDFSAAYAISEKIRVFAEVNNLTNEPLRYYHGITERPEQVEYYSVRGQVGIRASLF